VTVDEFRIGTAETYDVIVQPHEEQAYTIFAQPEARGRYARGRTKSRHTPSSRSRKLAVVTLAAR